MSVYQVVNPATNTVEKEFPTATDAEVQDILARSDAAYRSWRTTTLAERSAILLRASELYQERAGDLAALITREMGKRLIEARGETMAATAIYKYYAEEGPGFLQDAPLNPRSGAKAHVRKDPVGPLLGIMPWNFPYYQVARFAGPNLMIGNTIILKHAPQCPESALAMEQIFLDAGLPRDAYINVFATNDQAATIIADPRVAGVSVTGSERAGAAVAEIAGRNLKKVVLELGGSDPYIILDTDDMAATVAAGVRARMGNAGQACNAAKRFIVHEGIYDEFVEQLTASMAKLTPGDPTDPSSDFGPLSSESAAVNLMGQIEDAVSKGATVRTGGQRVDGPGAFVQATVLTDVTPAMRAFREELFGPAAVVYRVSGADEAIELANGSPFGLGGAVFSADLDLARSVADRLDAGMVWINSPEGGGADMPFGGTKRSGIGRELGSYGMDEFVNKKLIATPQPRQ
ncbi:MAG: NAD-dependent succinate-semialdehyde dehydrogenase [Frankiaceae bacterium]|jgi:succinate-semialdehyde dehydrogenase/glutarate-semialdehyde dehydrogenase|nr:NAD-dependent succinate-semialdehyde dehydrogenase [Frankiaceae bacterium]